MTGLLSKNEYKSLKKVQKNVVFMSKTKYKQLSYRKLKLILSETINIVEKQVLNKKYIKIEYKIVSLQHEYT